MKTRLIKLIKFCVFSFFFIFLITTATLFFKFYYVKTDFIQSQWLASPSGSRVRAKMLDDLLEKHPFLHKTREEIEALIGPPESKSWDKHFDKCDMVYLIGPFQSPVPTSSIWLCLKLSENRVTHLQVEILSD
jgi:hypothetical protein